MSTSVIVLGLLIAGIVAFFIGSWRASASTRTSKTRPHSRPGYHGGYLAIWTALPALLVTLAWGGAEFSIVRALVGADLPQNVRDLSDAEQSLVTSRISSVARGLPRLSAEELKLVERARYGFAPLADAQRVLQERGVVLGSAPEPYVITAAYDQARYTNISRWLATGLAAALAALGFGYAFSRINPNLRARNAVERVILGSFIVASMVAILTTAGIVLSMLFEAIHFFRYVPPFDYLFGTVWDPRFSAAGQAGSEGQFGLVPLLWGTLFISAVAMFVAVPVGLLSAIYMSEYASRTVRTVAKPLLEILAGIPTIVYGLFALITFGPFVRDAGGTIGLDISATSVLTAGVVMGVMIIPFVSSLSDDIINAVPQSLRDGSYGLGATQSETIKRVVFPAALPGIVGAILLAVSRAIGETMIVVLAAGIAANLTINPFEPVTTITVKIVSQLTGDLEFNSPQTLVAFALGLTLFIITLGLNIYALYVVRKYREQYE
ncbi:phosphate ABC transporter permease subunit PstC [Hyphomicrobium sp.]|uniref:phosphate ABC transporter permease subunit PstC n=1 Tax=Hyphomicrobium sp. TaxID=82 RepID=UPI0025BB3071|nr:phosphate ABC transporter permease subunit PstC [Hyphomicrobium sp.]MCC7251500.1 phosphate ABC transporter permease subunit PstC [Hyphomicrobium sp.]